MPGIEVITLKRKNMKKFKQLFQEKIILSFVMCVLLLVVLVTATTAWYASNNAASAHSMELAMGGIGGIKVAIEPGGEDISKRTELTADDIPIIPIKLTDLNNIREGMIGPGSYGPMTFYITSLGEAVTSYSIKVQLDYKEEDGTSSELTEENVDIPTEDVAGIDGTSSVLTEEQRKKLEELINDHISVYVVKEGNTFSDPLEYYTDEQAEDGTAATGPLEFQTEVMAEIYWVWNYEYSDIPGNEEATKAEIRQYDEEDTMLGNYIDNIWFNIYIEGHTDDDVTG